MSRVAGKCDGPLGELWYFLRLSPLMQYPKPPNEALLTTISRFITIALFSCALRGQVTAPDKFFGFQLGADGKMARWDKIVEYFSVLEKESGGKMKVNNMGPTTMGNPFLMVVITSPANQAKLEHLRQVNLQISDSRGLTEAQVKGLVAEGKVFCVQSMSLHANEIGGSQMAPELAYDLLARNDEETQRILDNVIFIEVPSFNPDGQVMVTDWYRESVGKEWEGTSTPWLYHKYAGHDDNRDAFMTQNDRIEIHGEATVYRVAAGIVCRSSSHGELWCADLSASLRGAGSALRGSFDLARAELVWRSYGL